MKSVRHKKRLTCCIVAVCLAAFFAGCALKPGKPPDFPSRDVKEVDIQLEDWFDRQKAAKASSTDATKIKALLAALQAAEETQEHKCGASGKVTLQYKDGSRVRLGILAGHKPRYYEFRVYSGGSEGIFRTDRVHFLDAMKDFGLTELDPGLPD